MANSLFSATKDREVVEASGFLCQSCLVGKSLDDQSPDPRYCQFCFEILLEEVKETPIRGRQGWQPVSKRPVALPAKQGVVLQHPTKGKVLGERKEGIMQHRGRPKKGGEVHRTTKWRRGKAEQGVLL